GHCYSYGNYEPASRQFRIRVSGPNGVVAPDMMTVKEIEDGIHIVTKAEEPLYSICPCDADRYRICMRELHQGERVCGFSIPISPRLWSSVDSNRALKLAGNNQREIPNYQGRIPIVDQAYHPVAITANAKASQ